jgi:protein-disulfide isomerase
MRPADDIPGPVSAIDHVRGAGDAAVTVIEYGDFECPNCKQAAPAVLMLLKRFHGRVRLVFRHFPLEEVHANALTAAEASEAAAAQGRFWEMHDRLFDNQPRFHSSDLQHLAESIGLNAHRFSEDLKDHVHLPRIHQDVAEGRRLAVRATPTFYVNGTLCDVSFGFAQLSRAIEKVLGWASTGSRALRIVHSDVYRGAASPTTK